jgi:hypothetical protein
MKNNDFIDVITKDARGKEFIRRVQVRNLEDDGVRYHFVGYAVSGENPLRYRLPKQPVNSIDDVAAGTAGWIPCQPAVVIDE